MASLSTYGSGKGRKSWRITFIGDDGKQKAIWLGSVPKENATSVKGFIDRLVASKRLGVPCDPLTTAWLTALDDATYEKLLGVELVEPRIKSAAVKPSSTSLAELISRYEVARLKVKPTTRATWKQTKDTLLSFFGERKPINEITEADADEWVEWLAVRSRQVGTGNLMASTVRRRSGHAKQFFEFATKKKLIAENPFAGLDSASRANRSKDRFVTRAEAELVLEFCPNDDWRLMFALSRYGGLRCPSEHLALCWDGIDWERGRMRVWSPKTAHHEGHESRIVPIFPELRPYLEAAWDRAEDGAKFVVAAPFRATARNRRTQLRRIVMRAGLTPWPKPWHNLRASRQTELEESFPSHVVCAWIGNSERIAREHYLQVTESHFQKATDAPPKGASRIASQYAGEPGYLELKGDEGRTGKSREITGNAVISEVFCESAGIMPGLSAPHSRPRRSGGNHDLGTGT
jgi:integrase